MRINAKIVNKNYQLSELFKTARELNLESQAKLKLKEQKKRDLLALRISKLKNKAYLRAKKRGEKEALEKIANLIKGANTQYKESINRCKNDCIDIIYGICNEIIGEEISVLKKGIKEKLEFQINSIEFNKILIEANSFDIKNLENLKTTNLDLSLNDSLNNGEINLITESGVLKLSWKNQLANLISQLKEVN